MSKKQAADLTEMTKTELVALAKNQGLTGYSRMLKAELVKAITKLVAPKKKAAPKKRPVAPVKKKAAPAKKKAPSKKKAAPVKKKAAPAKKKAVAKKAAPAKKKAAPKKKAPTKKKTAKKKPAPRFTAPELRELDNGAGELPPLDDANRIVLLPRDPSWLFTYWELTSEYKEAARMAGGGQLALRLHLLDGKVTSTFFEHEVSEWARSWYLPVPRPEQEYLVEIGYRTSSGDQWFPLVRSNNVKVPAREPSAWVSRQYATIPPDKELPLAAQIPAGDGPHLGEPVPVAPPEIVSQLLVEDDGLRIVVETQAPVQPGSLGFAGEEAAQPGSLGHQPGSLGLQPGSLGHQPGSLGHQPGSLGHQPGSLGFQAGSPGALNPGFPALAPTAVQAGTQVVLGGSATGQGADEAVHPLLEATAELVIAGRAFPGSRLSVAGQAVPVGPDGCFSLRISVPEGTREVPIEAEEESTGRRRRISLQLGHAAD